jgi:hypothetical protein
MIVDFIRGPCDHREDGGLRWGVEPICAVLSQHGLPIAPSMYYEHVGKQPTGPDRRDAMLINEIRRVHTDNYGVYGARKVSRSSRSSRSKARPRILASQRQQYTASPPWMRGCQSARTRSKCGHTRAPFECRAPGHDLAFGVMSVGQSDTAWP